MHKFKVSAPGKIILFGEHAVVYEKLAVAAALDQRVTLEFTELIKKPVGSERVEISLPKIDLCLSIPLQKIKDFFFNFSFDYRSGNHDLLYDKVQQFVATMIGHSTSQQKLSLEVFFYSLVLVSYEEQIVLKPFRIHLDTQLSIGSGLGSSASFAVCLTACFYHWSLLQKDIFQTNYGTFDLTQISQYALSCEKITHGNPSGIDTSVCTFGSILRFKKGSLLDTMPKAPSLKILLVDTQVERSTKVLVEAVTKLKSKYPAIVNPLMLSIEGISHAAFVAISALSDLYNANSSDFKESHLKEYYKELMRNAQVCELVFVNPEEIQSSSEHRHKTHGTYKNLFINMNQSILSMLKVSHPSLDKICDEARKHGLAAKLTGAGGGGYAYILIPPDITDETISSISQKLIADGFKVTQAHIGCSGVKIEN